MQKRTDTSSCPADTSIWRPLAQHQHPIYMHELLLVRHHQPSPLYIMALRHVLRLYHQAARDLTRLRHPFGIRHLYSSTPAFGHNPLSKLQTGATQHDPNYGVVEGSPFNIDESDPTSTSFSGLGTPTAQWHKRRHPNYEPGPPNRPRFMGQ